MLGFHTMMEIFTEANVGVFVATNRNWEAGGGSVYVGQRVNLAIMEALYDTPPTPDMPAVKPVGSRNLDDYTGQYAPGVYCHSCTPAEFMMGAWPRNDPWAVALDEKGLRIDGDVFLPTEERDVFVREDKKQEVFFGRDDAGKVSFYVNSFGPYTFEKVSD